MFSQGAQLRVVELPWNWTPLKKRKAGLPPSARPTAKGLPEIIIISKKVKFKLRFSMGDAGVPFVVDSTSKPFTYALCLDQLGAEVTISYVLQIWWLIGQWTFHQCTLFKPGIEKCSLRLCTNTLAENQVDGALATLISITINNPTTQWWLYHSDFFFSKFSWHLHHN